MTIRRGTLFLLLRLAAQNVGRRRLRTLFLGLSVTMAVGVGFAAFVTGWSLRNGIATSFSRMGADLVVVPVGTLVNITSTLLTVQPTDQEFDASLGEKLRTIPGIAQVAPQRIVRRPAFRSPQSPSRRRKPWIRLRCSRRIIILGRLERSIAFPTLRPARSRPSCFNFLRRLPLGRCNLLSAKFRD